MKNKSEIIIWPPGTGKTRKSIELVFNHYNIKRLGFRSVEMFVLRTLIVLPRRRKSIAWQEEIVRYLLGHIFNKEKQRRTTRISGPLKRSLIKHFPKGNLTEKFEKKVNNFWNENFKHLNLNITTYYKISRRRVRNLQNIRTVIFDEFHNGISNREFNRNARAAAEGRRTKVFFNSAPKLKKLFLSATPINPVPLDYREGSTIKLKKPIDASFEAGSDPGEKELRDQYKKCFEFFYFLSQKKLVKARLDSFKKVEHSDFRSKLAQFGKIFDEVLWTPPEVGNEFGIEEFQKHLIRKTEINIIRKVIGEKNGFDLEYKYAVGLVSCKSPRGKAKFEIKKPVKSQNQMKSNNRSWGHQYQAPFFPGILESKNDFGGKSALKWVLENNLRVERLNCLLKRQGILIKSKSGKYKFAQAEKVVIFCKHRGVVSFLKHYFQSQYSILDQSSRRLVQTVVDTKDDSIDIFNETRFPNRKKNASIKMLICSDNLSEMVSLHHRCRYLIHYELPWSPLTLFQRVGRLTRRFPNTGDFNQAKISHVIMPGSTEEEIVNRLIRRTKYLVDAGLLKCFGSEDELEIATKLLGSGPSLLLKKELELNLEMT